MKTQLYNQYDKINTNSYGVLTVDLVFKCTTQDSWIYKVTDSDGEFLILSQEEIDEDAKI